MSTSAPHFFMGYSREDGNLQRRIIAELAYIAVLQPPHASYIYNYIRNAPTPTPVATNTPTEAI